MEEFDVPESFNVEDDIFIDNIRSTKIQRLSMYTKELMKYYNSFHMTIFIFYFNLYLTVPENVEDEIVGTLHFAEQYEKRYGLNHPEFFTGTFEDAIKESCLKPAKEVCNIYFNI